MDRNELKEQLRNFRAMMNQMDAEQKKGYVSAGEVREIDVNGVPHKVRVYWAGAEIRPVYIDIHGGGMTWGAMENCDLLAREMNQRLGVHVISLDYPLVPDTEYPEPVEYLYGTLCALMGAAEEYRIDPERMFVGGRSAGGNLAAVMAILSVERGGFSCVGQILDHPWLDLDGSIPWEGRTVDPNMPEDAMKGLALGYAAPERQREYLCTPLNTPEAILEKLPPAIIQTCGKDPLNVEGKRYAELLASEGVTVTYRCAPEAVHGFSEQDTEMGAAGRDWIIRQIEVQKWV